MSYKLNKNLTTAFLAMFIILNNAEICRAQGVVSLVEDDNPGVEDDVFPQEDINGDAIQADAAQMDTELPNTISDEDLIPLDNGLLSPAEPVAPAAENNKPAETDIEKPAEVSLNPEFDQEQDFSLGLAVEDAPAPVAQPTVAAQPMSDTTVSNTGGLPTIPASALPAPQPEPSNNLLAVPVKTPAPADSTDKFANTVLSKIDNDLFSQMSDIEKQTTLLTLELRREKIRNEIEAIKAQREKAAKERIAEEEEKKRKEIEWQKEQEAKVLREQQLLKEKEIELEKLKQRKMLNAYMNQMLAQNQKWIEENTLLHKQMRQVEEDRKKLADDFKTKMDNLVTLSNKLNQAAGTAKSNHDRTVASLTAQNIQLKKRIEADALAAKNREQNPFANGTGAGGVTTSVDEKIAPVNLAKEYAIMEITGKGDKLIARLINKDGESFVVNKGTTLHTGHIIDDITERYIQFDKNGLKDYLYTSGSAIGVEPEKMEGTATTSTNAPKPVAAKPQENSVPQGAERGLPSLGSGMFVK